MSQLQIKLHDAVGTIILNRPDRRNALTRELIAELGEAFSDLHLEKKVRGVILTGAGSAFCAGMDLAQMAETSQLPTPLSQWHEDAAAYCELLETMLRFPKPIIAAVNGPAVAGGVGLILASDVVIAAETTMLALPEPRRGIVAGMVAPLLAFRVGGAHAARLLLTASPVDVQEARRIGIVSEVVPVQQVWARAAEIVQDLRNSAPQAIQLTKKLLNESIGETLFTQLAAGAAASATARTTEAAKEGVAAFLEKRDPVW
jgi:methylglutaconyl-CoA hydratase